MCNLKQGWWIGKRKESHFAYPELRHTKSEPLPNSCFYGFILCAAKKVQPSCSYPWMPVFVLFFLSLVWIESWNRGYISFRARIWLSKWERSSSTLRWSSKANIQVIVYYWEWSTTIRMMSLNICTVKTHFTLTNVFMLPVCVTVTEQELLNLAVY